MQIVKLTEKTYKRIPVRAEDILKKGGAVIGPSDTVYGLYCDATNSEAVRKIFKIKKRAPEKALPIFVKDIATARKLAYIDDRKAKFLEKVWPGAATVVFYHKGKLPHVLTGGLETVALRIPDHPFLLELLNRLDFPLAQSSANISGRAPIRFPDSALALWKSEPLIDLVIDAGALGDQPSTVVDFTKDKPIMLRAGIITKKELDQALGRE